MEPDDLPEEDVSKRVAKINEDVIVPTKAAVVETITHALIAPTKELVAATLPVGIVATSSMCVSISARMPDGSLHIRKEDATSLDACLAKVLELHPDTEAVHIYVTLKK